MSAGQRMEHNVINRGYVHAREGCLAIRGLAYEELKVQID